MWPWTKQDAPQAASEPPAAAAAKAPAASDDVWVDLLKCSLSEVERDSLIQAGSEEPCEFARGTVLRDGKGTERRVRLEGSELELSVHAEAVAPANPAFQDDLDDVSQLSHLNEASLLHHIASRYLEQHQIYTRAGPVLVAMNPFKRLPELYGDEQLARYQTSTAAAAAEQGGAPQHVPPPHVYEVAGVVYNSLRLRGASQSVVINGESGAGKTETAKIILRFLTQQCASGGLGDELARRLHASNPLLEAFGNCVTQRNDNSSRFGKLITLHFTPSGALSGGSVHRYLLEKSRVVAQARAAAAAEHMSRDHSGVASPPASLPLHRCHAGAPPYPYLLPLILTRTPTLTQEPNERSYHAFYQLCAGAGDDERAALRLLHPDDPAPDRAASAAGATARRFRSLCEGDCVALASVSRLRHNARTLTFARPSPEPEPSP